MTEVGDYVERADWFWDEKSKFICEYVITEAIAYALNELGADHTSIKWETLKVDDPRLDDAEPPKPNCYLRIGYVQITKLPLHLVAHTPLSKDLGKRDLELMRLATRKTHEKSYPLLSRLTDDQCDVIIDEVGPTTAVKGMLG